jgi:hypothetical protein
MQNPLVSLNTITHYDPSVNEEVPVDMLNIGRFFRHIYILSPFTTLSEENINNILSKRIDRTAFDNILNNMILYKASISIVRNMVHYGNISYCPCELIETANKFKYLLEENVLVLPIYSISFLNLQKYIDNFNGINTFNNFYDILIMNNYFGNKLIGEGNNKYKDKLMVIIKNVEETNYWSMSYNCMMNMTKLFDKRQFNLNILKTYDKSLVTIFNNIEKSPIKGNYIEQIFKTKNYVDPSEILKKKGFKLYSKVWSCEYTNDDILLLFKNLDNDFKYYLFCNLIASKQYCHLVINNKDVLTIMKPFITNNIHLVKYLFGYAWIRLYFEETINKFRVKTNDMYIFDINTACQLPLLFFNHQKPYSSPYMPIIVAMNSLKPELNIGGIKLDINEDKDVRISNLDEFKTRLNLFISGDPNINMLEHINMKELNIAISGSVMTACCQYKHPLMRLFTLNNFNDRFLRYLDEYYYDSDIDVMVKTPDVFKFIDITREFHEKIMLNVCHYKNGDPSDTKYELNNTTYLFVTQEFVLENICNDKLSYQFITDNLDTPEIKKIFLPFAIKMFDIQCKKKLAEFEKSTHQSIIDKYTDLFIFCEENLLIKIRNYKTGETLVTKQSNESEFTMEELDLIITTANDVEERAKTDINFTDGMYFSSSYKVRISSSQLKHDFELFSISKDDFMTTVANFHMPCVRAYYDGSNVYMTPSFITAHLTFMNIDYKYFAGSKDPINIINKYRMRGFGVWLNQKEIETYIKYCYEVPFWNKLFNINPNNKHSYSKCLGALNISHRLFKPRCFCPSLINKPFDAPYNYNDYIGTNTGVSMQFYFEVYPNAYLIDNIDDSLEFLDIETGYIKPLNISVIHKYKYLINKTNTDNEIDD